MADTMIRAFTGPSRLNDVQRHFVRYTVAGLEPVDVVRTGAAAGVDTEAAFASLEALPKARHEIYLPAAACNLVGIYDLVEGFADVCVLFKHCPPAPTRTVAYRMRNRWMIEGPHRVLEGESMADELVAFVHQPTFYRSGEWMTINIAKAAGVAVRLIELPPGK